MEIYLLIDWKMKPTLNRKITPFLMVIFGTSLNSFWIVFVVWKNYWTFLPLLKIFKITDVRMFGSFSLPSTAVPTVGGNVDLITLYRWGATHHDCRVFSQRWEDKELISLIFLLASCINLKKFVIVVYLYYVSGSNLTLSSTDIFFQ